MIRKQKKEKTEEISSSSDQLLTRSRVKEYNRNKKRNRWLNIAIVVVIVSLGLVIYAILNL
ncbi:hypothetical protein [Vagococcus sp.]|uniref:hypothetical protein n=1 Tax=Vagococcus sp. TaxID=1933889 RepID=UPI003F9DFE95